MLAKHLFVVCFLGYKTAVFPAGEVTVHDRGSVDGWDMVQRQHSMVPAEIAERRCLHMSPFQAGALLHSLKSGDECTMDQRVITCTRPRGVWKF